MCTAAGHAYYVYERSARFDKTSIISKCDSNNRIAVVPFKYKYLILSL